MKKTAWLLLIVGFVGGLFVLKERLAWEEHSYTLVYDYSEALSLAQLSDTSIAETLAELKKGGVASVAIAQYTVEEAARGGKLSLWDGTTLSQQGKLPQELPLAPKVGSLYIKAHDSKLAADLEVLLPSFGGELIAKDLWQLPRSLDAFKGEPLGLPKERIRLAQELGLGIVIRLENRQNYTPEIISYLLSQAPAQALLCKGDQSLGYPGRMEEVGAELKKLELPLALIEFSKQEGQQELARLSLPQILRLHTIPRKELDRMDGGRAIERYLRAATERGIPLLYLRPLYSEEGALLDANVTFVKELNARLAALGYSQKLVGGKAPWQSSLFLFYLVALAPFGGSLLVAHRLSPRFAKWLTALLLLVWVFLPLVAQVAARQLFALWAAVLFPLLAIVAAEEKKGSGLTKTASAGGLALAGGLMVSALLGSYQFTLGLKSFVGVKVAFMAPLALVGLWVFSPLSKEGDWEEFKTWLQGQLEASIKVWHLALAVIAAGILAVYLLRSGNSGTAPAWERSLREVLERIFRYRPRTKEFLFGYPLLLIGFSWRESLWQKLALVLGTVGLVSTINSFAHAHSPLIASFVRSLWGLLLGLFVGWLVKLVVDKLQGAIRGV